MLFLAAGLFHETFAQTSKLDEKNGFNKFQLGEQLSAIVKTSKLKKVTNNVPNSETYIILDVDNYSIAGYPLQNILLTFYKKRLLRINVMMPEINAKVGSQSMKQSEELRDKIIAEYGKWTKLDLSEEERSNNVIHKSIVSGTRVSLFIVQFGLTWIDDQPYAKGNVFTFLSNELYAIMEKDLANDSGF